MHKNEQAHSNRSLALHVHALRCAITDSLDARWLCVHRLRPAITASPSRTGASLPSSRGRSSFAVVAISWCRRDVATDGEQLVPQPLVHCAVRLGHRRPCHPQRGVQMPRRDAWCGHGCACRRHRSLRGRMLCHGFLREHVAVCQRQNAACLWAHNPCALAATQVQVYCCVVCVLLVQNCAWTQTAKVRRDVSKAGSQWGKANTPCSLLV
jgi:hypothetical protein